MKPILVVATAGAERRLVDAAADALGLEFQTACRVASERLDVSFAFHSERNQYHSSAILERLSDHGDIVIAITDVDLYIPILTFVFGEAHVEGPAAVVSYHRLRQQFYGLPADDGLTAERLAKEAVHELGHVLGLTHCDDYECVMAASHAVEWLDLKRTALCDLCWHHAMTSVGAGAPAGTATR
ncbi:MAG: archaemetzincin family Zn-dependent metalloprotease [Thermoanaerobaculia bacterium]